MKNIYRISAIILLASFILQAGILIGGNDKRRGTAGCNELLINPWPKSSGWGGVNTANGRGLDALFTNPAGLAFTARTELQYAYTDWFHGAGVGINAAGLAQRITASGVIGLSFVSMNYADEDVTKVLSPERGANGKFSPSSMNINVSYAHSFSSSIRGGATLKVISTGTDNINATGVAVDAGIQYVSGDDDEIKFGLALKNIGPPMSFAGNGMAQQVINQWNGSNNTLENRSLAFELPTILNIGASYDFLFKQVNQRFTLAGNFTSNAFGKDKYILGGEYAFLSMFQVRAGYVFEDNIFNSDERTTFMTGLCAGVSIEAPLMKKKGDDDKRIIPVIRVDYSYRTSDPMGGVHTIGIGLAL